MKKKKVLTIVLIALLFVVFAVSYALKPKTDSNEKTADSGNFLSKDNGIISKKASEDSQSSNQQVPTSESKTDWSHIDKDTSELYDISIAGEIPHSDTLKMVNINVENWKYKPGEELGKDAAWKFELQPDGSYTVDQIIIDFNDANRFGYDRMTVDERQDLWVKIEAICGPVAEEYGVDKEALCGLATFLSGYGSNASFTEANNLFQFEAKTGEPAMAYVKTDDEEYEYDTIIKYYSAQTYGSVYDAQVASARDMAAYMVELGLTGEYDDLHVDRVTAKLTQKGFIKAAITRDLNKELQSWKGRSGKYEPRGTITGPDADHIEEWFAEHGEKRVKEDSTN